MLKVTENALVPIHNGLNRSFYTQFEIIDVRASSLYTIFFSLLRHQRETNQKGKKRQHSAIKTENEHDKIANG